MTIAYWCVLITALMPYLWTGIAKFSKQGYDNHNPRVFLNQLEGAAQRANWAQMNAFEAFPAFATAVILSSYIGNINSSTLNVLSIAFVICRLLHGIFYIADKANLRTVVWILATICWIAMFVLSV